MSFSAGNSGNTAKAIDGIEGATSGAPVSLPSGYIGSPRPATLADASVTLIATSNPDMVMTPTVTRTITLASTSIPANYVVRIVNKSPSVTINVNASGGGLVAIVAGGSQMTVMSNIPSPTVPADWNTNSYGDAFGPGSAVDNAIVRFDGTTGKVLQSQSAVTMEDNGDIKIGHSDTALARIHYKASIGQNRVFLNQGIAGQGNYGFGVDSSNLVTLGTVTGVDTWDVKAIQYASSGAVTLGPSSGPGAITHILNSAGGGIPALMVNLIGSNECRIDLAHNGTRDWSITSSSGGVFNMYNGTSTAISVSADCYDVQLGRSGYRAFASSPFISGIYRNCHVAGTSGRNNRSDPNYTGGAIEVVSTPSTGQEVINFWTNDDGEGATTAAKQAGQVDSTASWRIGPPLMYAGIGTQNNSSGGYGIVDSVVNVTGYSGFTGSNTARQGGVFRLDTRDDSSQPLFSWYARAPGVALGTVTLIGRATNSGAWSNISGGSWGVISDLRLKKNIHNLNNGLSMIMALRPVSYEWIEDQPSEIKPTEHFIAQEVEQVNTKWVREVGDEVVQVNGESVTIEGVKTVHFDASFNATLVKAIQELKAELDVAKARIEALESGN